MLLDKLVRWVQHKATDRSGLLSTATALVVDVTRQTEAPKLITFPEWLKLARDHLPAQAVAFLQIYSDWTIATIVDVEKRTVSLRVQLPTQELGTFSAAFLRTKTPSDTRSIMQTPKWFTASRALDGDVKMHAAMAMATTGGNSGEGAAPAGVVAPGDKPPRGPRVEALVTLAEETATIQTLPVIAGQPLEA